MKLRQLNKIVHRDIGFFIVGVTLLYAISGIALNHKREWNSNYIIDQYNFTTNIKFSHDNGNVKKIRQLLVEIGENEANYKTNHYPCDEKLTIFLSGGTVTVNTETGQGYIQRITKRPILYQVNFLHYNPGNLWKWFSDIYCIALILVVTTGIFIVRGRKGIRGRGAILMSLGILVPMLLLFFY